MTPPPSRRLNHERTVTYRCYARDDGLFDIEGRLRDCKGFAYRDRERGVLSPGEPVHDICATITIDEDYIIHGFSQEMRAIPFGYCLGAQVDAERLKGACLMRGWRKTLAEAFGPHGGCTHLRELMQGMGTAAFQTISAAKDERLFDAGFVDSDRETPPPFLGGCHSWQFEGPVVARWFPQFHRPKAKDAGEG
ncbi:DUF2889 domain-containing protein [Amorphus sp. 3PC139-8]|uniref:DUF2889 domain-containing protein n=1 Tax=Amorphus sp. 3PC139-8 TaxID=2735676 RepID=UPI00345C6C38